MKNFNENRIPELYKYLSAVMILVSVLGLASLQFYVHFKNNQVNSKKIYNALMQSKQNEIISAVEEKASFIEATKRIVIEKTKARTKARVYEAISLCKTLYQKLKATHTDDEIRTVIRKSLSSMRFDNGRGYFFILRSDGVLIHSPPLNESVGKNITNYKDVNGNTFIDKMVAVANSAEKEGYIDYWWYYPHKRVQAPKTSYVKLFEPYDWIIGQGDYIDDVHEESKQELIRLFSAGASSRNFSLFQLQLNDTVKPYLKEILVEYQESKDLAKLAQKNINKIMSGGYYVCVDEKNNFETCAYFRFIPKWNWIVASTIDKNEFDAIISQEMTEIDESFEKNIRLAGILLSLLLVAAIVFSILLSKRLTNAFKEFKRKNEEKNIKLANLNDNLIQQINEKQYSQTQLKIISENIRDVILNCNTNEVIKYASSSVFKALGFDADDLVNKNIYDYIHPEDKNRVKSLIEKAKEEQHMLVLRYRHKHKRGDYIWVESYLQFVYDDNAKIKHIIFSIRDVSQRKLMKDLMKESEQLNRAVIMNSPVGISVRSKTGTLLIHNESWQRIWQLTTEEINNYYTEREELSFNKNDSYLDEHAQNVLNVYKNGGHYYIPEMKLKKARKGKAEWISQHFYALEDREGKVDKVVVLTQDITRYKNASSRLNKLQVAVEQAKEGIAIADSSFKVVYSNNTYNSVYGKLAVEVLDKPLDLIKNKRLEAEIIKRIREQGSWRADIKIQADAYSKELIIEAEIADFKQNNNDETNYLVLLRDITKERNTQKQLWQTQKLNAIGVLAGGIAHDFNNILMAIYGQTYLLDEAKTSCPEIVESVDELKKAQERGKELVKQILTFSRSSEQQMQKADVAKTVDDGLRLIKASFPSSITFDIDMANIGKALLDPIQLQQIVMNLCSNAKDAMNGKGKIKIIVKKEEYENNDVNKKIKHGKWLSLEVVDTGTGIDDITLKHMFEPFYTTKKIGDGTGLGLSTIHGIVEQSKGYINVNTQVNKGTSFKVYLPWIEANGV